MGRVAYGAGAQPLLRVGLGEDRIEPADRLRRTDATERREDDWEESASLIVATGQVLDVLLQSSIGEERHCVAGSGGEQARKEGAGDASIEGEDRRKASVIGDHQVGFGVGGETTDESPLALRRGGEVGAHGVGDDAN